MAGTIFEVQILNLDKLQKAFKKAPETVGPIMQEAIVKGAAILANNTTPGNVPWITGTLARSFNPVSISQFLARWYPRVNYARAVQFGRSPERGRYVPAIGKRLKNGSNIGMWPGFKGRHFMEKILSSSKQDINILFKNALKTAVSKIAQL